MLIAVTEQDLIKPDMSSLKVCPVAKAMTRAFGVQVSVGLSMYIIGDSDEMLPLPLVARKAIYSLIWEQPVQPFTFDV